MYLDYNRDGLDGTLVTTFGWDGDYDAAIANPGGSFYVRDGKNIRVGFGIFNGSPPPSYKWYLENGYLPCLITEFERQGCAVKIFNFADRVGIRSRDYVVAYSRVSITNPTGQTSQLRPEPSKELLALSAPPAPIHPGKTAIFDYAIAIDRFGQKHRWPSDQELRDAGSFDSHHAHMTQHWEERLGDIVQLRTPDPQLNDAFKAAYIYTHIVKDGYRLHVGENGYDRIYSHDCTGTTTTLFLLGCYREATQFLENVPSDEWYHDARWKLAWPFAVYLLKTGDKAAVEAHFGRIKTAARTIGPDRTGPGRIMKITDDIDSKGCWTVDNWSALTGLSAYRFLCLELGQNQEAQWAQHEYEDLLDCLNKVVSATLQQHGLNYLPVSPVEPNDANRCRVADDANWAAQFFFGRWAWDAWLMGGSQRGINLDLIDATYDYGFARLAKAGRPPGTFGGYGERTYCSSYNAAYGGAALRGRKHRTAGVEAFRFMIDHSQSGPYAWWESCANPIPWPWQGEHPAHGAGSCPHIWGQISAVKVLLESVVAEFFDGRILIGRGVPNAWLLSGKAIEAANVPIRNNHRLDLKIERTGPREVTLTLSGDEPGKQVLFNLPLFAGNIASASAGAVDRQEGCVTIEPGVKRLTVTVDRL